MKFIYALCIALTLWIGISFIDVVSDNSTTNPEHWEYNFFSVITMEE